MQHAGVQEHGAPIRKMTVENKELAPRSTRESANWFQKFEFEITEILKNGECYPKI
jgi:hypothetical protein